jgi:hypothetical protein
MSMFFQYILSHINICFKHKNALNCCEFIAELLTKLDLIDIPICLNETMKIVFNIHKYELNDGYHYLDPRPIGYDIY